MAAQVLVDTGGSHLAGRHSQNHRGRAGDAVPAGENPLHAGDAAVVGSHNVVPVHRHPGLGKVLGVHRLAHGHENHVAGDNLLGLVGIPGGGTAAPDLANHLGLDHKAGDLAILIGLDGHRSLQGKDLATLGHGALRSSSGRAVISAMRRR